jgi:hypothetical protein
MPFDLRKFKRWFHCEELYEKKTGIPYGEEDET